MHVIGQADVIVPPASSKKLAQRFVHTETALHDGQHYIFTPFPGHVLDRVYRTLASLNPSDAPLQS